MIIACMFLFIFYFSCGVGVLALMSWSAKDIYIDDGIAIACIIVGWPSCLFVAAYRYCFLGDKERFANSDLHADYLKSIDRSLNKIAACVDSSSGRYGSVSYIKTGNHTDGTS